jgi:hypothetical protein
MGMGEVYFESLEKHHIDEHLFSLVPLGSKEFDQ